jgi:hypothetical protein
MRRKSYLIGLKTANGRPRLDDELTRELVFKTLRMLECDGLFEVTAFVIRPRGIRMLLTTNESGRQVAKRYIRASEELVGLARRHRFGRLRLWSTSCEIRRVDDEAEHRGFKAMLEADARALAEVSAEFYELDSSGRRWRLLRGEAR